MSNADMLNGAEPKVESGNAEDCSNNTMNIEPSPGSETTYISQSENKISSNIIAGVDSIEIVDRNGKEDHVPESARVTSPKADKSSGTNGDSKQAVELDSSMVLLQAMNSFELIYDNILTKGPEGFSPYDHMPCECEYNHGDDDPDDACGSSCINRQIYYECLDSQCRVGEEHCKNRRFQKKEYAPIEMFITKGKGYGVRAADTIQAGRFILEYLGEVMSTTTFSKRVKQYEKENYEHYYCMALDARSMIDATKKGGIARFLNHSCNPNCEMEKWTVGKRYRMGIFAKRTIQKGEELTFDYKFVRYNAEPQKCLCLEPNCKGTIGITKNIAAAPGEEDDFDDLDEDLEDVSSDATKKKRGPKALENPEDVKALVKKMLRTEEKKGQINRIIDILLITESVPCLRRFVQLHGISILKAWLSTFPSDYNIIRRVVQILLKLPINTKNTVDDNKIEPIVRSFEGNQDLLISTLSKKLLENWNKLNLVYRIPKAPKKPQTSKNVGSTEGSSSAANGDNVLRSNSDKRNTLNNIPYKKPFKDYGDRSYAGSRRESVTSGNSISDLNKDKKSEFYKSREAKEALLTDLPNDWDYAFNGQGEAYFFNRHSKGSQWDFPFSDLPQEKRDLLFKKLDALYEKSSLNGVLKRKSNEDDRDIKRNKIEVVGSKDSSAASLVVEDQEPKKPSALVEKYTEDDIQKVIEKAKRQKELEEERLRIQQKVLEEEKEQRRLKKLKRLEEEKAKKAAKRAERELKKKEALESSSSSSLSAAKEADPVASAPEKSTSIETSPGKQRSTDQKSEFREQVSNLVIKYFSRFKNKLSPDDFKKHARKITHLIMEKESKESAGNSAVDEEVIKRKIKKFVVSYGDKLISRPADKID